MALAPLTPSQQSAVDSLVNGGRLEKVLPDATRAKTFADRAEAGVESIDLLVNTDIAYNVGYDACHDLGEAVLAAYGYRTRAGSGQHVAVGAFLRAIFSDPPGKQAASDFDRLRRSRNKSRYDVVPVGRAQVKHAKTTAQNLITAAWARGVGL